MKYPVEPLNIRDIFITFSAFRLQIYYFKQFDSPVGFTLNHGYYELHYTQEGNVNIVMPSQTLSMTGGDLCLLSPNVTHRTDNFGGKNPHYILLFDILPLPVNFSSRSGLQNLLEHETLLQNMTAGFCVKKAQNQAELDEFIKEIKYAAKHEKWENSIELQNLLSLYIIRSVRQFFFPKTPDIDKQIQKTSGVRFMRDNPFYIFDYIRANHNQALTLKDIGDFFHISERQISRYIHDNSGMTFKKLLNGLRVEYAKFHLDTTNLSADQISQLVGFESLSYFLKVFKKTTGTTVTEYRAATAG